MKTNLMITVALMVVVVSFVANAQDRTFYGEYEEYSSKSSESVTLARCVEMTVTECGACAGNYDSGNCPKECYGAEALCIPVVQKQTAAPPKNKKAGEAWKKLKITISTLTENQEAFNASLVELKIALDALGNCHNGKGGADAEYACHPALDARVAELENIHNNVGGPEAELQGHPELTRLIGANQEIQKSEIEDMYEYVNILNNSTIFKFDIGALALGSTDFRDTGIIAGALQIAANFGVTEDFRFTLNGAFGGGKGREGNAVWALGSTAEFLLNDKGTLWLGPAVSGSHEGSTDRNFNTFLGAGISLRAVFPESHHGYFAVTALVGDNMHFIPDVTGEYDEVMHHHVGAGLQFAIGFSAFRDPK